MKYHKMGAIMARGGFRWRYWPSGWWCPRHPWPPAWAREYHPSWYWYPLDPDEEARMLEEIRKDLEKRLSEINKRIEELKKSLEERK
ncbi:MAG: DUF5320 domain-containing protein [Nitrososphaerota archaeon]